MTALQTPVLETSQLSKKFGHFTAVENFNIRLAPGEIFGLLGPNGAGKTTIIRMLLGLIKPSSGEININGYSLKKHFLKAITFIGSLVEIPAFYPYLTGRQNLELLLKLTNDGSPRDKIDWALERVNLTARANDTVKKYSQGMRQRLGIAAAILNQSPIIILDEPTNGLDPEGIMEIRQLIHFLAKEKNLTFLISSHLLFEVEQICDRISILNQGKTIASGSVAELITPSDENLEKLFFRLMKQSDVSKN